MEKNKDLIKSTSDSPDNHYKKYKKAKLNSDDGQPIELGNIIIIAISIFHKSKNYCAQIF